MSTKVIDIEAHWQEIREAYKQDWKTPEEEEIAKTTFYLGAARSLKFLTEKLPELPPLTAIKGVHQLSEDCNDFLTGKLYEMTLKKDVERIINDNKK